jgi:hypothetical protein
VVASRWARDAIVGSAATASTTAFWSSVRSAEWPATIAWTFCPESTSVLAAGIA